jgi:amino acid adenylation domain-containing protein
MKRYLAQHSFDNRAKKDGDKLAIYFQNEFISNGDLYSFSNRLANCLKTSGISRGDRVLLMMKRSPNFIRGLLGVLKADAIYVPVDDKSTTNRALEIASDCAPSAIICDQSTLTLARGNCCQPLSIFVLGSHRDGLETDDGTTYYEDELSRFTDDEPEYANIDADISYIIYTSGSTGKPKGVAVSHLNIFNYIDWALEYFAIDETDNILSTSLFHFDMSVFDIYCPLLSGCSLTIAPDGMVVFPNRIMALAEQRGVTIWKAASSVFSYFTKLRALKAGRMSTLQQLIFSGEHLPTKVLVEWMRTYPDKTFFNAYGPSECTGISTCYKVPQIPGDITEAIPIGKACANTEVFAMTEDGKVTGVGETGELFIRSSSMSSGYWNDGEKTEKVFVGNPVGGCCYGDRVYRTGDLVRFLSDGNFVFLGRRDEQVKVSGYRIEIGEIERAMQGINGIEEGVVISVKDESTGDIQLVGFVESRQGMDAENVKAILGDSLPKYMVPARICFLANLPRNENGKVDKRKLADQCLSIHSERN